MLTESTVHKTRIHSDNSGIENDRDDQFRDEVKYFWGGMQVSEASIVEFLKALGSDEKLAAAMCDAVGERHSDAAAMALAGFAHGHGYDVDAADVGRLQQAYLKASAENRDLSDDELAGVDGGLLLEAIVVFAVGASGTALMAAPLVGAMVFLGLGRALAGPAAASKSP